MTLLYCFLYIKPKGVGKVHYYLFHRSLIYTKGKNKNENYWWKISQS